MRRGYLPLAFLGAQKKGGNATSAVHSRGSPTNRTKLSSGSLPLGFLEAQKRAEML